MKKRFYIFIAILFVAIITGCSSNKEEVLNCSITLDDETLNYTYNTKYKVIYVGNIVKKVELIETISSESDSELDNFKSYLDSYYKLYNEYYGGVSWEITKKDNELVSNTVMDYTKMNLKKLANNDDIFKSYLNKNNELTLTGLKTMYELIGVSCE